MWAMGINTDPSSSRNMDPDMVFGSSLGLNIAMAPVAVQGTQISMILVAAWSLGTNMVLGDEQNLWHPYGLLLVITGGIDMNSDPGC